MPRQHASRRMQASKSAARTTVFYITASLTLLMACGSDDPQTVELETVQGRLEPDGGDQLGGSHASEPGVAFSATAHLVTLASVGEQGDLEVWSESTVTADGRFEIDLPPGAQPPFIVQVHAGSAEDEPFARVIVPAAGQGAELVTAPVSPETTVEAEAFLALVARGHAPQDIDAIELMANISAEMAACVESGDELAEHLLEAQSAWLASLEESGAAQINAAQAQQAKVAAWTSLVAKLDASADPDDRAAAWSRFEVDAHAAVEEAFGSTAEQQLLARSAASSVLQISLQTASADQEIVAAAAFLALSREVPASWIATVRLASETAVASQARSAADAAFAAYVEELHAAADLAAALEARAQLTDALVHVGGVTTSQRSVIEIILGGELITDPALALAIDGVMSDAIALEAELVDELHTAFEGADAGASAALVFAAHDGRLRSLMPELSASADADATFEILSTALIAKAHAAVIASASTR